MTSMVNILPGLATSESGILLSESAGLAGSRTVTWPLQSPLPGNSSWQLYRSDHHHASADQVASLCAKQPTFARFTKKSFNGLKPLLSRRGLSSLLLGNTQKRLRTAYIVCLDLMTVALLQAC